MKTKQHAPRQLCATCGRPGRRRTDECQQCSGIPLVNGQWIIDRRRRVLVWERT